MILGMSNGDPETRERILQAARELMEERQGQNVPMSDVAEAAGVSRQALYLHFGSRSALLLDTVQYVDEQEGFRERAMDICTAHPTEAALEAFIAFWAGYVPKIYGMARALLAARGSDEDAAQAFENRMAGLRSICALLASRLKDEGYLADRWSLEAAADFIWAMISIQTWENLRLERGWSESDYVDAVRLAILGALFRPADSDETSAET